MGFCVLYYQTIIFTGLYQLWGTYALKPENVSEMHFHANSKKTQSLGKNGCRQKCLDKSMKMYGYGTSKDLICKKEETKCNSITKQNKK